MVQIGGFFRRGVDAGQRDRFRSELDEEMMFQRAQAAKDLEAEGNDAESGAAGSGTAVWERREAEGT